MEENLWRKNIKLRIAWIGLLVFLYLQLIGFVAFVIVNATELENIHELSFLLLLLLIFCLMYTFRIFSWIRQDKAKCKL
ncbi:MAG: hypothetical protein BAA01_08550 [Bacillus thermozeamaize]|uniref:Uncharacterized protein n=1 Tax=Bacillus thermozeamaize TaxID=230954 RepID=A0A1Y3PMD4_9BACI|nr:MAG: hypothetical protein BAA01_08550 [Bacillus thermozeamaize]